MTRFWIKPSMALLFLFSAAFSGSALEEKLFIRAGTMFDGERFHPDKIIVVAGGLIEDVYDAAYPAPPDAIVIDARGMTVTPGFVNAHAHLLCPPLAWLLNGEILEKGYGRIAQEGLSLFPENRLSALRHGITSVLDMGNEPALNLQYGKKRATGLAAGPRLYTAGPLFTAPGGHPAGDAFQGRHSQLRHAVVEVDDPETARGKIRELAPEVDFVKIVYDKGDPVRWKSVPRLKLEVACAIIEEAHECGLRVFAHAGSREEALAMLQAGVDGIEHCFNADDEAFRDMAARGTFLTPTLTAFRYFAPDVIPRVEDGVVKAFRYGTPVAVGDDFPNVPEGECGEAYWMELELLEKSGITRADILKAATYWGAKKIGRDGEFGVIRKGLRADLLIFTGDLSSGTLSQERLKTVIMDGKIVIENENLAREAAAGFQKTSNLMGFPLPHQEISSLVFAYPFYDPLYGISGGCSVNIFNVFNSNASLSLSAQFNEKLTGNAGVALSLPSPVPRTSWNVSFSFDSYGGLFFGEGNDAPAGSKMEYGRTLFGGAIETKTMVAPWWFLTGSFMVRGQSNVTPAGSDALPVLPGRDGAFDVLAGAGMQIDLRDNAGNPWYGFYAGAGAFSSLPFAGSTYSYQGLALDLRGYIPVFQGHVIAIRLEGAQAFGETPFYLLPAVGGPVYGRGYPPGRFIDKSRLGAQLEYRFPILEFLSLFGFLDAFQVQPDIFHYRADAFHVSCGGGIRAIINEDGGAILNFTLAGADEGMTFLFSFGNPF